MEYPAEFCQGCLGGLREHFTRAPSDVYILCGSAIPLAKIDALCQDIANGEDVCVYRPPPKACRQT